MQPWWLDVVCGQYGWGGILLEDHDLVTAAMPFQIKEIFGIRILKTPPFSGYSGPWFTESTKLKAHSRLAEYEQRLGALIQQLPRHEFLDLKLDPKYQNALPFVWKGYDVSTLYTYTLDIHVPVDEMIEQCNRTVRKALARRDYDIIEMDEVRFFNKMISWNGNLSNSESELLKQINGELGHHLRILRIGSRCAGEVTAVLLAFISQRVLYLLASGVDKSIEGNMGFHQIVGHLLRQYNGQFDKIDFLGSMQKEIAFGFRALSAHPQPYLRIRKKPLPLLKQIKKFY